MRIFGRAAVSDFLGDLIVYRNLAPIDTRLPGLAHIRRQIDLPAGRIPRKSELDYARVIVRYLLEARKLLSGASPLRRLLLVGDTQLNDGTAFANISRVSGRPGIAFIGSEKPEPPRLELRTLEDAPLYVANRWTMLYDFDAYCRAQGYPIDDSAAVILDLDKTTVGARGRNDGAIDAARIEAVHLTVADLLGGDFAPSGFRRSYDLLNQPAFHPFTADNQDYLVYVCLIIAAGLVSLDALVARIQAGELHSFAQFLGEVDARSAALPHNLRALHTEFAALVSRGDPTPLKQFRYHEYRATAARFGAMPDTAAVSELLDREIVITQEVREMAIAWRSRGALLFGLSDKPDEASIPSPELLAQGYRPIHRLETHAVGLGSEGPW